jgi:hypothetical protein
LKNSCTSIIGYMAIEKRNNKNNCILKIFTPRFWHKFSTCGSIEMLLALSGPIQNISDTCYVNLAKGRYVKGRDKFWLPIKMVMIDY